MNNLRIKLCSKLVLVCFSFNSFKSVNIGSKIDLLDEDYH